MAINKQRLESALSTLNQDNMGDYYLGEFTSLLAFVRAIAFQPPQGLSTTINLNQLAKTPPYCKYGFVEYSHGMS